FAQEVQERNYKVKRDGWEAIRHPINLLIKGIMTDWNKIKIMLSNSADDAIRNITRQKDIKRIIYPTEVLFITASEPFFKKG
ncbi:prolyl 4-Hydroxylase alpha-subunit, region, partial [Onchocerca flexuosa]